MVQYKESLKMLQPHLTQCLFVLYLYSAGIQLNIYFNDSKLQDLPCEIKKIYKNYLFILAVYWSRIYINPHLNPCNSHDNIRAVLLW